MTVRHKKVLKANRSKPKTELLPDKMEVLFVEYIICNFTFCNTKGGKNYITVPWGTNREGENDRSRV